MKPLDLATIKRFRRFRSPSVSVLYCCNCKRQHAVKAMEMFVDMPASRNRLVTWCGTCVKKELQAERDRYPLLHLWTVQELWDAVRGVPAQPKQVPGVVTLPQPTGIVTPQQTAVLVTPRTSLAVRMHARIKVVKEIDIVA